MIIDHAAASELELDFMQSNVFGSHEMDILLLFVWNSSVWLLTELFSFNFFYFTPLNHRINHWKFEIDSEYM